MKLFQIEEPAGGAVDPSLPGAAIGVDLSGAAAEAAFAVGGNPVLLREREEFDRPLPVPEAGAVAAWHALFEGVRLRAERTLARPVSHAVVVLAAVPPPVAADVLHAGAAAAGIEILRLLGAAEIADGDVPALFAARLAEDLVPRPATEQPAASYPA
jgi:hypothetical protein